MYLKTETASPKTRKRRFFRQSENAYRRLRLKVRGSRYYNPDTTKWLSRDPIEENGGLNLYGFCGNEPVGRWDYLGHGPSWPSLCQDKCDKTQMLCHIYIRKNAYEACLLCCVLADSQEALNYCNNSVAAACWGGKKMCKEPKWPIYIPPNIKPPVM